MDQIEYCKINNSYIFSFNFKVSYWEGFFSQVVYPKNQGVTLKAYTASLTERYGTLQTVENKSYRYLPALEDERVTGLTVCLSHRYGQLYGLLQHLLGQVHGVSVPQSSDTSLGSQAQQQQYGLATNTRLDLNWYLQLVRNR